MKRGLVLVLTSDIWAGVAQLSLTDAMQVIASTCAIISTLMYLGFYIRDRFKKD